MFEKFPNEWKKLLDKQKITKSTLIQEKSYDILTEQKSAILLSPTGTGKTLAYLWPILQKIRLGIRNQVVIIAPSQELAMQIFKVVQEWAKPLNIKSAQLIGGANINRQIDKLKKHPEIVIGTPGRLVELMNRKKVRCDYVSTLVFDEFDMLLKDKVETNFSKQIIKKMKRDIQKVYVSATNNSNIMKDFFTDDIQIIDVTKEDDSQEDICEYYIDVPQRKRVAMLKKMVYTPDFHAIVFFNSVQELGVVADKLQFEGVVVSTLASDENKFERKMAISTFEDQKSSLLLTTDLSSRGLDLQNVDTVVNYDLPEIKENYTHRIGRVGRLGKTGQIYNLVTKNDLKKLKEISKDANSLQEVYIHHGMIHFEK